MIGRCSCTVTRVTKLSLWNSLLDEYMFIAYYSLLDKYMLIAKAKWHVNMLYRDQI